MSDPQNPPIRDAATIVLVRGQGAQAQVLMGQRGAGAAFMPSKYVFPGGAVDAGDALVPLGTALAQTCTARLAAQPVTATPPSPAAMAAAAIRELYEEAGLMLAVPGAWPTPAPADWAAFERAGLLPHAGALTHMFRAVTPPGRTRRFDARFFMARAEGAVLGDLDDFSRATDELSHLHWIELSQARSLDLPFITEVVLAEAAAILSDEPLASVPFFDNSTENSTFRRIA